MLIANASAVPGVLWTIISSAFGFQEAAGGITGGIAAACSTAVKRGLFSNEAGMVRLRISQPWRPLYRTIHSSQGFVQSLGVFIDTILICTATSVMILLRARWNPGSGVTGTQLTQAAMSTHIGSAGPISSPSRSFFFAFTSIIGNYSYAENALTYLGGGNRLGLTIMRCATLAMVVLGAYESINHRFRRGRRLHGTDGDDQSRRDPAPLGDHRKADERLFRTA